MSNSLKRSAHDRAAGVLGRERVSNGRVKTREDRPIHKGKAPGVNLLFLTDLEKLARGRRGYGTLTLRGAELILDDVIPRLAKRWKAGVSDSSRLVEWVDRHLPEIFTEHDEAWAEARRKEVLSWTSHALLGVDDLARKHRITKDEVEGFCLCSLVSFERPKRVRQNDQRAYDRQYSQHRRSLDPNYVPRNQSLKARWRRKEFGDLTWEQLRHRIRKGLIDPNIKEEAVSHNSSETGLSVMRTDEKCENQNQSPGAAAAETHVAHAEHQLTGRTMFTRSTFITLKSAAISITHVGGLDGSTAHVDFRGLHTAGFPIQGKTVSGAGTPVFYIPAIAGCVVEVSRPRP